MLKRLGFIMLDFKGDAQVQEEGEQVEEGTAAGVQEGYEGAVAGVGSDEGAAASV